MSKPHKHAALIKAWADGAVIEYYSPLYRQWFVVDVRNPKWHPHLEYRRRPAQQYDLEKYGAKAGDVWIVNGERLLFTFVSESDGVECFSLASDRVGVGAFDWDWEEFKKGKLLFRANEVNKL